MREQDLIQPSHPDFKKYYPKQYDMLQRQSAMASKRPVSKEAERNEFYKRSKMTGYGKEAGEIIEVERKLGL